jgi:1-acyl-sn-glycerol-3-phosphate acyltransferase
VKKRIAHLILRMGRWKLDDALRGYQGSSVMIGAPHTSNWDFVYAIMVFVALDIPVRFTIKKEWMRFPFGGFMRSLGAIPIDRSPLKPGDPPRGTTEAMAALFKEHKNLVVLVTPEATRSKRSEWKTGFYYVAVQAGVPIGLGYLDYEKRRAGVHEFFHPSGDIAKDMHHMMAFYSGIHPKNPENFSVDTRYYP